MLLTVTPLENPGPPSPVPPPTAPKPKKDNARLQRLLRKAAKRSGPQPPPAQSPKAYRSTLSPVTEGDLESPEPTAPQRPQLSPLNLPTRFQTKGLTHRVPSPYPKQRGFTFTVSEQHSLSQYLSPSPIPEAASPCTAGSGSHDNAFLFPPERSASDNPSLRVNANVSPRPTTPRHVTFNPSVKHTVAPLITVSDLPLIITTETDSQSTGLISINIDETFTEESQSVTVVSNAECGNDTIQNVPDQQASISIHVSCSPVSSENKPTPKPVTSQTPEVTKTSVEGLRVVEVSCNASLAPSKPTDVNQTTNQVCTTDGVQPLPSEVKTKSLQEAISPSKDNKTLPKNSTEKDGSTFTKSPNTEEGSLLKTPERPKAPRKKPGGGWARLMKHLVVEPDEPKFPETQPEGKDTKTEEEKEAGTERTQQSKGQRANKMWDALLYHMATSNKGQEKPGSPQGSAPAPPSMPFLRSRLPLLLHRPRFDARKLKEAASRPLRRVTAFFHRRLAEKESSTFNRTASGWSLRGEDAHPENTVEQ
ncbi:proline-rich protein 33 [Gastrophryne carolinensis]